jgi:nucleic acid/nucleotide deaminase of polymorphic system toxin
VHSPMRSPILVNVLAPPFYRPTVGGVASVAGGGKFANGAVTGAFQYLATASLETTKSDADPRMSTLAMGPEDAAPGIGPYIAAAEVFGTLASSTPAGDANDNGFPQMPEFTGGKTTGILVTAGDMVQFQSGWGGPATDMPKGSSDYDIVTRTHVEGDVAAYMQQQGVSSGTLYINNPVICSSCTSLFQECLPRAAR